jgi:hypothetical protein
MKLALRRRQKQEMVELCDDIQLAEENGYDLSEEEEILFERILNILDTMNLNV